MSILDALARAQTLSAAAPIPTKAPVMIMILPFWEFAVS